MKRSLVLAIIYIFFASNIQVQSNNYLYHTVFIYNFCKYIQWPEESDEVIIGVMGNMNAVQSLQKMASAKSTYAKRFTIKKFNSITKVSDCHVLFVTDEMAKYVPLVAKKLNNKAILLITETPGIAKKGSCINFIMLNNRLTFEINMQQLEKTGLKVPNNLLRLAIIV